MNEDDTGCFQILGEEDDCPSLEQPQSNTRADIPAVQPQQGNGDNAGSFNFHASIRGQFQEEYSYPIRKKSTLPEQWFINQIQEKSLQEVEPESLMAEQPAKPENEPKMAQQGIEADRFNKSIFSSKLKVVKAEIVVGNQSRDNIHKKQRQAVVKEKQEKPMPKVGKKIDIVFENGQFLWKAGQAIEVNLASLQILYDEMFLQDCFIPLFKTQLYSNWNNLGKYQKLNPNSHDFVILKTYLERYTQFLQDKYQEQLTKAFLKVKDRPKQKIVPSSGGKSYFRSFNVNTLISNWNIFSKSSKMQIVKKAITKKIQSLEMSQHHAKALKLKYETKKLEQTLQCSWKQLSHINLLLSLQETETYCQKRQQSSTQNKSRLFWVNYRSQTKIYIKEVLHTSLNFVVI